MSRHTTWKVGGPAWCLCRVRSQRETLAVIQGAQEQGLPWKALGAGSNLLVTDQGYPGVMLRLGGSLAGWSQDRQDLVVGAGLYLATVVKQAARLGLSGLEWAAGIPGSTGGAVANNAGAHQGQMSDLTQELTLLAAGGRIVRIKGGEAPAQYRRRALPAGSLLLAARLRLSPSHPEAVVQAMGDNLERRRRSQPLGRATAGSVFKNPPGDFAGRLIEAAGLKGLAVGPAMVSQVHANFIENRGGASAAQVLELMELVRHRVAEQFGVELEPEVEVVGNA
jgi:UDP-N-acetylmuramate dehydrogenase